MPKEHKTIYPDEVPEEIVRAMQESLDLSTKFMLLDTRLEETYSKRPEWYDRHSRIISKQQIKSLVLKFVARYSNHLDERMLDGIPEEFRPLALEYLSTYREAKDVK